MRRPSFQFYPDDWSSNSNLKRCTHEEKGIWIDVMCVLHDQDEYGIARWPLAEIAQAVGTTKAKLKRLVDKGVLKGADAGEQCEPMVFVPRSGRKNGDPVTLIEQQEGPLWYSSRMVLDEYKRMVRGGIEVTPKDAPDPSPKGGIGEGMDDTTKDAPNSAPDSSPSRAGASSPSSSSSPTKEIEPIGSLPPSPAIPCPVQSIVDAYHELMPDNPTVRVLNDARRRTIAARWREAARLNAKPFGYSTQSEGIAAWREFFAVCNESAFLTGKKPPSPGRDQPFIADLDFLMSPKGFTRSLENKYHREEV